VSLPGSPQADYEALVIASSPSAYWTLGDAPGSTTALDQMSGTTSGTASGLVVFGVPGPVGWISTATAASFDGATASIAVPGSVFPAPPFTWEVWASTTGPTAATGWEWMLGFSSANATVGWMGVNPSGWIDYTTSSGANWGPSDPYLADGNWHHLVVTLDASGTLNEWVDGDWVHSTTGIGSPAGTSRAGVIGQRGGGIEFFSGSICNVAL